MSIYLEKKKNAVDVKHVKIFVHLMQLVLIVMMKGFGILILMKINVLNANYVKKYAHN